MIDKRALDAALEAFHKATLAMARQKTGSVDDCLQYAIEAYEAANWRPIGEAPRDGTWILISRNNGSVARVKFHLGEWLDSHTGIYLPDNDTLFRTITPPPQNAEKFLSSDHDQPKEKTDA